MSVASTATKAITAMAIRSCGSGCCSPSVSQVMKPVIAAITVIKTNGQGEAKQVLQSFIETILMAQRRDQCFSYWWITLLE